MIKKAALLLSILAVLNGCKSIPILSKNELNKININQTTSDYYNKQIFQFIEEDLKEIKDWFKEKNVYLVPDEVNLLKDIAKRTFSSPYEVLFVFVYSDRKLFLQNDAVLRLYDKVNKFASKIGLQEFERKVDEKMFYSWRVWHKDKQFLKYIFSIYEKRKKIAKKYFNKKDITPVELYLKNKPLNKKKYIIRRK